MSRYRELAVFCRKMNNALNAGFDIEKALLAMKDEERGMLRTAVSDCIGGLRRGKALSESMRDNEWVFTPELVNLIYITEQTGHYDIAFKRMAVRFEQRDETSRKIMQAAIYPAIVLIVFIGSLIAVAAVWHFLPQALAFIGIIFAVLFGAVFLRYGGQKLSRKSLVVGNVLKHAPFCGRIIMQSELADLADNMSVFYSCGVSPAKALRYCAESVSYEALKAKVLQAAGVVERGNPLSDALEAQHIFPRELINSLRSGEASGNVDGMLCKVSEYYRQDIQNRLDIMMTFIRQ